MTIGNFTRNIRVALGSAALLVNAAAASAGITVDQTPAVHLTTGQTMDVNIADVRPALDSSGAPNAACDVQVDIVDADGVVVQSTPVTMQASKTLSPCFLTADGTYRAVIAGPPERSANPSCKKKDLRVLVQVHNSLGETQFVMYGLSPVNHNQTLVTATPGLLPR
jgi:hypothetical protein